MKAGWKEIIVVTDHGWLLLSLGLPKVELKAFLAENRWGRCASMKADAQTELPTYQWYWNPAVAIATPSGVGCFRASTEYTHGGVSLQEMVTPVIRVTTTLGSDGAARLVEAKWTSAKCRVSVAGDCEGCRVDVRTNQSASESSLLSDRQSRETTSDGKVTVFLEDDSDIGRDAVIVLLDASGQVIDSLATTLGE
jgi:Fe-S cluster biogenesis protein NfuA